MAECRTCLIIYHSFPIKICKSAIELASSSSIIDFNLHKCTLYRSALEGFNQRLKSGAAAVLSTLNTSTMRAGRCEASLRARQCRKWSKSASVSSLASARSRRSACSIAASANASSASFELAPSGRHAGDSVSVARARSTFHRLSGRFIRDSRPETCIDLLIINFFGSIETRITETRNALAKRDINAVCVV